MGGVALDLDHAVAAGSLSPRAMEHLGHRPDTHCLLLAVVLALLAYALTRRKLIAWSIFAVLVAHLLFDAAGGNEHWLYPLGQPDAVPWLACPVGIAVLVGISAVFARRMDQPGVPPRSFVLFRPVLPDSPRQSDRDAMNGSTRGVLAGRRKLFAMGSLLACLALAVPLSTQGAQRNVTGGARPSAAPRHLIFSEDFSGAAGARPNSRRWTYDIGPLHRAR
jgi:hypothetical protein